MLRNIRYGFVVLSVIASVAHGATRYVKTASSGTADCSSWANACTLQNALTTPGSFDQIWVAQGTYQGTIALIPEVKIYGGFSGNGSETLASQSNPALYPTVLDGNGVAPVVTAAGVGAGSVLRGFRITNGNCQRELTDPDNISGGGLYVSNSGALFVQCTFDHNTSRYRGAAVFIDGTSNPWFVNCIFKENGTGNDSGADTNARPWAGGAVFVNSGQPTFMNCLFHKNRASDGAAIFNYTGMPEIVNSTFVGNRAANGYGGALHDEWGRSLVRNCIFWDNSSHKGGNQVFCVPGNEHRVSYSNVQGGWPGATNLNVDPQFLDASAGDFKLGPNSPCADQGRHANPNLPLDYGDLNWNTSTSDFTPLDLAMVNRRFNIKVDLGAYERQTAPPLPPGGQ